MTSSGRRGFAHSAPGLPTVVGGLLCLLLCLSGCPTGTLIESSDSTLIGGDEFSASPARLLVLLYMNADNELEAQAIRSLNQLESIDLWGSGVEVLALVDRSPGFDTSNGDWTDTRIVKIGHDAAGLNSEIISSFVESSELGIESEGTELNLGDPSVLERFLAFASESYPAQLTLLVLWGHGSGWRSTLSPIGEKQLFAVGFDDSSSADPLYTHELATALSGHPVDVLGFDCCSEALLEVAYELRGAASVFVASEDLLQVDGWDYAELLPRLADGRSTGPEVARAIVDSFAAAQATNAGAAVSAIDLSSLDEIMARLNGFSDAAYAWVTDEERRSLLRSLLFREVEAFFTVPGDLNIDIVDLCDRVAERIEELKGPAEELESAVHKALLSEWHHPEGHPRARGLALHYVPLDSDGTAAVHDSAYFKGFPSEHPLQFVNDSSWVPGYPTGPGLLYRLWYEVF